MIPIYECQSCKQNFTIEPEDFVFYEKIQVPPPTWCPDCRLKRRLIFRNARKAFLRPDTHSGKIMFSGIPPRFKGQVYHIDYWRSDAWDPLEYGRDYDFSKTFFEQFRDLWYSVPWSGQSVIGMVNSEYCDQAGYCKNAYLCFNGDAMEDSAYTVNSSYVKDCFDLLYCLHDELCYSCTMVDNSYRTFFSLDCDSCTDVWFSRDLVGCSYCFGCSSLRNKSYCFFNTQLTKEEYEKRITAYCNGSWTKLKEAGQKARNLWNQHPVKYYHGSRNQNSSGERVKNTKNANHVYNVIDAEDVKYTSWAYGGVKDSYDYSVWGVNASLMYESLTCGEETYNIKFCFDSWPSIKNLEYCVMCRSSSDLLGCVGVKKKQYCILNKQYDQESFDKQRGKIIRHMNELPYSDALGRVYRYGEFFPPEFSPFAYNETMLNDIFPLDEEKAEREGYQWEETPPKEYQATKKADDLPDLLDEIDDSILKEVIACTECKRVYRIISGELTFYRRMNIPIPRTCIECRTRDHFSDTNSPAFQIRTCECEGESGRGGKYRNTSRHSHGSAPCGTTFETAYSKYRPEIVYCEQCYQAEVV